MEILFIIIIIFLVMIIYYDKNKLREFEIERNKLESYNYSLIELNKKLDLIIYNLSYNIRKISLLKPEKTELFESLSDKIVSFKRITNIEDKIIYYDKLEKCLYRIVRNYDPIEDHKFIEDTLKEIEEKYRI